MKKSSSSFALII
jgi:hypothetical protein